MYKISLGNPLLIIYVAELFSFVAPQREDLEPYVVNTESGLSAPLRGPQSTA